jgi:hypothetical protein
VKYRTQRRLAVVSAVIAGLQIVVLVVDHEPSARWPAWLWWTAQVAQPLFLASCAWTLWSTPPQAERAKAGGTSAKPRVEGRA